VAGGAGGESHLPLARETSVGTRSALSALDRCASNGPARAALGVARSRTSSGERTKQRPPAAELEAQASTPAGLAPAKSAGHEAEASIPGAPRRLTKKKPGSGRKPGAGWRLRFSRAQAGGTGGARKRTPGNARQGGDRSISWWCSRGVWIAEVDERRLVLRLSGHEGLIHRLSLRGSSAGEAAPEPGRSGEGHEHASSETGSSQAGFRPGRRLVDGRCPGPVKPFALDEAAMEAGRVAHGDGSSVASNRGSGSHGAARKDARGYVACSVRG